MQINKIYCFIDVPFVCLLHSINILQCRNLEHSTLIYRFFLTCRLKSISSMLEFPNLKSIAVYYNYCQCLKILIQFCLNCFPSIRFAFHLIISPFFRVIWSYFHSIYVFLARLFWSFCVNVFYILSKFCVVCMWSCSLPSLLIWCRFGVVIYKVKLFSPIYYLYNLSCLASYFLLVHGN